jgi:transcriptional regulator with XRE-family HTH domain
MKIRKRPVNLKLKAAIVESGMTMTQVAEMIGTPKSNLSNKIHGYVRFNEEEMEKLANVLNKKVTEIFFNNKVTNPITNEKKGA